MAYEHSGVRERKHSGKLSSGDKLFWQGGKVGAASNRQTNKINFLSAIDRAGQKDDVHTVKCKEELVPEQH